MRGLDGLLTEPPAHKVKETEREVFRDGIRGNSLFVACMLEVKRTKTEDGLIAYARSYNAAHMQPPMIDGRVVSTAKSAWGYEQNNHNFIGRGNFTPCANELLDGLGIDNNDAFMLRAQLQRHHGDREWFYVANAMAEMLRWTLRRFQAARRYLVEHGYIVLLRKGGRHQHDPSVYGWPRNRRTENADD
jgi:hypothetical protein